MRLIEERLKPFAGQEVFGTDELQPVLCFR